MRSDLEGLPYEGTIHESLGISALEASPDRVVLEMEVGPRVHQPFGLLHGGASAVIAESAASLGAYLSVAPAGARAVGIELSISHLRSKRSGLVRASATAVRKGRTFQVWSIELTDEEERAIALARCPVALRPADALSGG
jgi:1,4-dihydroxy-2-naphthoyl-CoA hydrolase